MFKVSINHFELQIVASVIDPLLQAVSLSAARLTTTDMAVYLLNCFHQMASTLALYEFTDQRLERLQVPNSLAKNVNSMRQ